MRGTCDFAIANFWWGGNLGALLTAYALQRLLREVGCETRLIAGFYDGAERRYPGSVSERFAQKFLDVTAPCVTPADFRSLNGLADGFICGSDQIWRGLYTRPYLFLDFADIRKRKVAVSASFGVDRYEPVRYDEPQVKRWLKRFSAVSVREKSGVGICRDTFGVEAAHVPDPVFLADRSHFDRLVEASGRKCPGLVSYLLDPDATKRSAVARRASRLGLEIYEMRAADAEDWVSAFATSEFVATDSFHGMCFALLYRKPFVCFGNEERGNARFVSVLEDLGIDPSAVLRKATDADDQEEVDWEAFYRRADGRLLELRNRGIDWIRRALRKEMDEASIVRALRRKKLETLRYGFLSKAMWGTRGRHYAEKLRQSRETNP